MGSREAKVTPVQWYSMVRKDREPLSGRSTDPRRTFLPPRPPSLTDQKWSTGMLFITSTFIGSIMYVVGLKAQLRDTQKGSIAESEPMTPATETDFRDALEKLKSMIPLECISWNRDDLLLHGRTQWSYHTPDSLPGAVLYPRSTEDVVQIVQVASKYKIPLVPYSGGTSLEGHFNAPSNKISTNFEIDENQLQPGYSFTVDFSKNMNKIIALHESDMDVVVQPGISYEQLNVELEKTASTQHLFFPVDPGPGAMIGGMIGTGCSGTNAVKYGTMRENVINLTAVLPNGQVIKTRQRAKKSAAGPDLTKLFVGSEGTLGLVTEATLKLQPALPTSVGVAHFSDVESATETVLEILKTGISLSCIELLDDMMMKAINKSLSFKKWEEKPSLFLKFTGTNAQIKADKDLTANIVKSHGGSKIKLATSDSEAADIWNSRKIALWSSIDYVPGSRPWTTDVCVPISKLPQLVSKTKKDLKDHGLTSTIVGHVGDGNFHCIILFKDEDELAKTKECVERMVVLAQDLDGTCTGEHGARIGKKWALERELGKGTIEVLRSIKQTIDPQNIMNPGKLIPEELDSSK
ncbi:hypothetical protein CROQUDRAFT_78120 [Cronartium quercuum f. sp. fusiforme G11]|uniref:D-lactate dehydrogenase (cytochrome) n=1 Tax=Cronartium quercuum f. sp. fusiforme G11 TaxID=708437 RepID=A0A9P6TBW6_9BASI|nr:hypothetical protein CROQUDRAFT_78120 [Cronartium quercuum f. sp. fusiforme G11]